MRLVPLWLLLLGCSYDGGPSIYPSVDARPAPPDAALPDAELVPPPDARPPQPDAWHPPDAALPDATVPEDPNCGHVGQPCCMIPGGLTTLCYEEDCVPDDRGTTGSPWHCWPCGAEDERCCDVGIQGRECDDGMLCVSRIQVPFDYCSRWSAH